MSALLRMSGQDAGSTCHANRVTWMPDGDPIDERFQAQMLTEESGCMTALIASYEDAVLLGSTLVGGKGWNLGRLHRYGFPVPPGGILIAQAYSQFMQQPPLRALCAELSGIQIGEEADRAVVDKLHTLRASIEAAAFCSEVEEAVRTFLVEAVLADVPVAVRSSATT